MTHRVGIVVIALLAAGLLFVAVAPAQQPDRRNEVVRALLRHSRPLSGTHVEIPISVYHRYLRDLHAPECARPDAPIPFIAETGTYHLIVETDFPATLKAKVRLRVFDPQKCLNIPILGAKNVIWEDLSADNKGAILTTMDGWVRFTAPRLGLYTITGRLRLKTAGRSGGTIALGMARTVRTAVVFDSPLAWEVHADRHVGTGLIGTVEMGTHGLLALKPTNRLRIKYNRPMPRRQRPPRYLLRGDVAWNLGAGAQQITASLTATIAAGASDRIELLLPSQADRVEITGPEVRRVQVGSGRAVVHLRGKILGPTVLKVSYELPAGGGSERRFGRFGVADGRWAGGTLVVTNTAGGSEILPASMTGLREMSLSEVPPSASAILPAPAVMAYEITSREFSAEVEVLQLGRFALRRSIVDLAHYEVFLARDGSVICRARYEIRNSNRQFLRLKLPAGAQVLLARVNEKSRPISPATGKKNTWLLPLERSRASVMGLVSFPAEVVFLCRTAPMGEMGVAEIPLPAIDLPIAYGWCETYIPAGLAVEKWSGVMKKVSRFSSETATASLDYGWGELAAGYTEKDRPTVRPTPTITRPTTQPGFVASFERETGLPSRLATTDRLVTTLSATPILARNYYRTGKAYYDKNEFAEAARYLEQVAKLAPGSAEARNARRLLANPQMPKARKAETKAEKAAARVVQREVAESNIFLEYKQKAYIQSGKAAAREGRYKEAAAKLKAAQGATEQLIARGAERQETLARMRKAEPEMEQLRKKSGETISRLRGEMSERKKAGEYEKALEVASELQQSLADSIVKEDYSGRKKSVAAMTDRQSTSPARLRLESEKLQKEMKYLAAAASRKRQKQAKAKGERDRIARAHVVTTRPQRRPTGGSGGGGAITNLERTRRMRMQQQVARQRTEIERRRLRRSEDWGRLTPRDEMMQQKREKIATLKAHARTLRDEQEYRQAIEVCDEIRKLDPNDIWAKEWHTELDRFVQIIDAREAYRTSMREEVKQLNDVRQSQVFPWGGSDITLRRKPMGAGEVTASEANRAVLRRLRQRLPRLDFSGIAFGDVVQFLREVSDVSIHVKWSALETIGVDKTTKVSVNLTNVTLEKTIQVILDDVGGVNPLGFVLDEGVITITTVDDLSSRTVTRVYDIRDLVVRTPNFKGPKVTLRQTAGNNNNAAGWGWGDDDDDGKTPSMKEELTSDITDLIRSTIDPDTWREAGGKHASIRELSGQIIVTSTAENQQALMDLLAQLRQARGPQVEEGKKIAQQKAADPLTGARIARADEDGGWRQWHGGKQVQIKDRELDEFIRRNYDWALKSDSLTVSRRIPDGGTLLVGGLVSQLRDNLGQKVVVNSRNVNADTRAAAALGVRFNRGSNNVDWAVINEAQFRSLMELDAELTRRHGRPVAANERLQETIVGTDAFLSNSMVANITFAGDKGNTLDISSNTVNLAHEGYLLLYNGQHLTVVRAGAMQHWRETPTDAGFVEVPQNIEVPRVGQLFRFERTLLKPSDQMVLRVEYKWKGVSQ